MPLREAIWICPLDGSHGGTARASTSRNMERTKDRGCECCLAQTIIKWPDTRVSSQTYEILSHRSKSITDTQSHSIYYTAYQASWIQPRERTQLQIRTPRGRVILLHLNPRSPTFSQNCFLPWGPPHDPKLQARILGK